MKTWKWVLGASFVAALGACGDETGSDDGDDGTTSVVTGTMSATGTNTQGTNTSTAMTSSMTMTMTTMTMTTCDVTSANDSLYPDPACNDCVVEQCCSEAEDCAPGTDCADFVDCFDGCDGDAACQMACGQSNPDGVSAVQAAFACSDSQCEDDCATTAVCRSSIVFTSNALNECLTANCCDTFDPCFADPECSPCLTDSMAPGCDTNALFAPYDACFDANCPTGMCGTEIGFAADGDPIFECNSCATENCCVQLEACIGDGSQTAIDMCVDCVNGDAAACTDQAVEADADAFNACLTDNCAMECGG